MSANSDSKINNPIKPVKLSDDTVFKFSCHKGLSCFNKCCNDIEIFLSPYDILRLRNALQISSDDFLSLYTEATILLKTNLPFVKLRLKEDGDCPFVKDEGCSVYDNRPLTCRYYPLGFGAFKNREDGDGEFYYLIEEDFCNGRQENEEWTVRKWRDSQGIDVYNDLNKEWFDIILTKKLNFAQNEPDEKTANMYLTAAYNIDGFRRFVFESRFLSQFDVPAETVEKIRNNDEELMVFAHKWLKVALFGEATVKLKNTG